MLKKGLITASVLVPMLCFAQPPKTTLGVYALHQTVTSSSHEDFQATGQRRLIFYDGLSHFLGATLIMGSDTLRVKSDFPGHLEFGEVRPGSAELIIENLPELSDRFLPYSQQLTILPGDNVVFVELKLKGENTSPLLRMHNVSSEEMENRPMPVTIEQDGLHYAVNTKLLNVEDNETYARLESFPGLTIRPRELVLSGDETTFSRTDNTLVLNYLK